MRRIVVLLMLAAAASGASPAEAQSREERDVRALLDRFLATAHSLDEKVARQYIADHSRSGGPFFPTFGPNLGSTTEVEAITLQGLGALVSRSYKATSVPVVRADKNLAWAAYPWRAELTFKDGTQVSYEGRATAAFVREGKAWKFVHWHSSVAGPPPLLASVREAESQKILAIERNAWEAIKTRNPDAVRDYFAENASIFQDASAYRMSGKDNLLRGLTAYMQSIELRSYQMLEPKVDLYGDIAVLTYYFTESGVSAGRDFSRAGKMTLIFLKQSGVWRALHEHRSVNR